MYQIQNLTSDPLQLTSLLLPDGTRIDFTFYYRPIQQGWFLTNLSYVTSPIDFQVQGIRITNSPNILHQYRNQIPFGLTCISVLDREPTLQKDFSSGASKLYVLTSAEVSAYQGFLSGL